ncbi:MAG: hypothetical protein CVV60_05035, partial [Tenericutes bacterium HGW-Tenericutes-5]
FLFVITSFAWYLLNTQSSVDPFGGSASGIVYDLGGDFIAGSVIYPELNVISESITITNYSPEDLYLRIKVEYTRIDVTYDNLNYTYSIATPVIKNYENVPGDEHLAVSMNANFFYETDGYWYFDGQLEDSIPNTIITSISYDGFKVSNEYANSDISISIIIEITTDLEGLWSPLTTMIYTGTM